MKSSKLLLTLVYLTLLVLTVNAQSKKSNVLLEDVKKIIAESNAIYFTAYHKNDASIFVNRYTKDACLLEPNKPLACGSEVIEQFFRSSYERGTRDGEFITTAVYGDAKEYVTEEGILKIYNGNGELTTKGKYLVLWKRTSQGWKMYRDSFSSDTPKQ